MRLEFNILFSGASYCVDLNQAAVLDYRATVEEMARFFSIAIDRQRRAAHNKVAAPILSILREQLPTEDESALAKEARDLVTLTLIEDPDWPEQFERTIGLSFTALGVKND